MAGAFLSTAFMGIFLPALTSSSRSFLSLSARKNGCTFFMPSASIMLEGDLASTPASLRSRMKRSLVTSCSLATEEIRFLAVSVIIQAQCSIPLEYYSPSGFFFENSDSSSENFPEDAAAPVVSAV